MAHANFASSRRPVVLSASALSALALASAASATPIGMTNAILNPGFETVYETGTTSLVTFTHTNVYSEGLANAPLVENSGGTTNPASPGNIDLYAWNDAGVTYGTDGVGGVQLNANYLDSTNMLYFGGVGIAMDYYQDLGPAASVLLPNTTYNYSVQVYSRTSPSPPPLSLGLSTGATIGTSTVWTPNSSGTNTPPTGESESTYTFTYVTGNSLPTGDLYVYFGSTSYASTQVGIDNVSFAEAPEPASLGLLGVAAGGLLLRRKRIRRR